MLDEYSYAQADADYYSPLAEVKDPGQLYSPTPPPGWQGRNHDIWQTWQAPGAHVPEQGWKIHVSAQLQRAQPVLDTVSQVCFEENVSFKHVRAKLFFLFMHHKHAPREQAGKFCAVYPPDEASARRLLERLSALLADEEGPYVLSDRRYRDSRTVHYRWGAFRGRARRRPDGTPELLVRDAAGRDAVDVRRPSFVLPPGMADPFLEPPDPATAPPPPEPGPPVLHGFQVVAAVRASNAGGTYEGREVATGRRVFMKEARAHNGLHWDGSTAQERLRHEHDVLVALHAAVPGVAPEPLAHFREWEHEFLVTEFVEGTPLNRWMSLNAPVIQADRGAAPFAAYYTDCARVLEDLDRALMRLHGVGYRFGDVNPTNVLVTPQGGARLVDFEAATHRDDAPVLMGANGYVPPDDLRATRPFSWDEYGANAIALAMLLPVHAHLGGSVRNLRLLYRDLEERAPLPAWLARRAGRSCSGAAPEGWLPTPEELDARPRETLVRCAEEVERALLAMAEPGDPARVFPTVPRGYRANTTCVAYGTAGVLHALHSTGASVPEEVVGAFRAEALARRSELPPGLHVGAAGVAWVLAEYGLLDEADELLQAADRHPIALASTTLGEGIAGLGMAHLALHRRTGDERWMTRAAAAGDAIRATPDLTPTLGANDARGLLHGRAGLALFLAQLTRATGEAGYLEAGRRLVHAELDRAIELPDGALSFADDAKTNRAMPYLYAGAAGMLTVATRYAAVTGDERIAAALPRIAADVTKSCTLLPGLYAGLAGLAFALAEHADWAGDDLHGRAALRVATGLAKYAAPHAGGLRFLGEGAMRYSAELWSGGAGVLLALHRVLHGHADQLFTLDSPLGLAIDGIAADDAGT